MSRRKKILRKRKSQQKNSKTKSRAGKRKSKANDKGKIAKKKVVQRKKKRDLTATSGLNKNLFSRIKQEYHDIDYIDKLSPEEKKWLSTFMEEDLGARLNHNNKKIYKKKKDKAEVFRRNNQRNRDLYSLQKATGKLDPTPDDIDSLQNLSTTNPEDAIIDMIDLKSEKVKKS